VGARRPAGPFKKGRGATISPPGRYERRFVVLEEEDDPREEGSEPAPIPTTVFAEASRSILTRNDSPDIPFDRSINPYRGCEHGCVYCFARPTHAYWGLSPGLDFETKIFAKTEAARLLRRELSRPGYRPEPVALGANTDPYQPVERRLRITRGILEVLAEFEHPVMLVTKSAAVVRDLDLLVPMAERRLVQVFLSVTTLDAELARRMEPRASSPRRRLQAMGALKRAGVPVGVLASPVIPGLNDSELERILEAAAEAGATSAGYALLRLPLELREIFPAWLEANYPTKSARILALVRETRGGKLYESAWGRRLEGRGAIAELIARRFEVACRRLGLARRPPALDRTRFQVPSGPGGQPRLPL